MWDEYGCGYSVIREDTRDRPPSHCIHPMRYAAVPRPATHASDSGTRDPCVRTLPRVLRAAGPRSLPASPPGERGSP